MNVKNALAKVSGLFTNVVMSPRLITGVGIVVALVQLAAAVETFTTAAKSRKKIGFSPE